MGKTEAIVLMACDAKVAAQSAVAYAKQGSQPRAAPIGGSRLPGSCAPLTAHLTPGVGYPHPLVMHAELMEEHLRTRDAELESGPGVGAAQAAPKDEWQEYVRGVVYGGLVRTTRICTAGMTGQEYTFVGGRDGGHFHAEQCGWWVWPDDAHRRTGCSRCSL